ncbi:MAG: HU family DNA-binding protein [Betaproteobacteria bacterium]|nr:HU family DNA-binding protein [Betaproteobacteria bacterium]
MNKTELIEKIAAASNLSKADAGRALTATVDAIVAAVASGNTVSLVGFGSFKTSQRAARTGKNPRTGEAIKIAAATLPRFSAGAGFKAAVNAPKGKKKK